MTCDRRFRIDPGGDGRGVVVVLEADSKASE